MTKIFEQEESLVGNEEKSRYARVIRETKETRVSCELELDGQGMNDISTGIGFLDHMLDAFSRHSRCDLKLYCKGDLHIDQHHSVEDVGITLGQTMAQAIGEIRGIERFGMMSCPLDEALCNSVVDISGRPYLHYGLKFQRASIGQLDSSLIREFFGGFVLHAKWTLHLDLIRGENDHHVAEAAFKAFARSARDAWRRTALNDVPSTKGVL